MELIEFNVENKIKNLPKHHNLKEKLYARQKGLCSECQEPLKTEEEQIEIHHITRISQGGYKSRITNLTLMHKHCHKAQHRRKGEDKNAQERREREELIRIDPK